MSRHSLVKLDSPSPPLPCKSNYFAPSRRSEPPFCPAVKGSSRTFQFSYAKERKSETTTEGELFFPSLSTSFALPSPPRFPLPIAALLLRTYLLPSTLPLTPRGNIFHCERDSPPPLRLLPPIAAQPPPPPPPPPPRLGSAGKRGEACFHRGAAAAAPKGGRRNLKGDREEGGGER